MDKKKNNKKDINELAYNLVFDATQEQEKSKVKPSNKKGRLGGLKGGEARAKKLTLGQRSEIARLAAIARWKKSSFLSYSHIRFICLRKIVHFLKI